MKYFKSYLDQSLSTKLIIVCSILTFGFLILNIGLFWIPGDQPVEGARIYYSQRYNKELYELQCLSLPLAIGFWIGALIFTYKAATPSTTSRWILAGVLMAGTVGLGIDLFANLVGLYVQTSYTSIGSVVLDDHLYRLDLYLQYDEPTIYYFVECDLSGDWCEFHPFYESFLSDPGKPQIMLNSDATQVIVKFDDGVAYTYDGQQGSCAQVKAGWCFDSLGK